MEDKDRWEVLGAHWSLVTGELDRIAGKLAQVLSDPASTLLIEDVRFLQGRIMELRDMAGIVPRKLKELEDKRGQS